MKMQVADGCTKLWRYFTEVWWACEQRRRCRENGNIKDNYTSHLKDAVEISGAYTEERGLENVISIEQYKGKRDRRNQHITSPDKWIAELGLGEKTKV